MAESEIKLTIGEQTVDSKDVTKGQEIDLKFRDPEKLHDEMRVKFHDILGEPDETVFSFDFIWRWAFKLFTNTKLWCYRITSLICGLPLSIFWGVYFACLSFCVIWCCEPYMKAYAIELSCARRIYETFLNAFYRPCFEACGYCFYNIRTQKLFTNTKLWCYRITSLICGLPLAIFWGIYFAILSFCTIWCCEPYMVAYAIELRCARRLYETFLNAFYRPCFEACGYIFHNIRIQKV